MEEQTIVRKQLYKNMVYNVIEFTLIFGIFSTTVFLAISGYLYASVDRELYDAANKLKNTQIKLTGKKSYTTIFQEEFIERIDGFLNNYKIENPKIVTITRDENGEILNGGNINGFFKEDLESISFDANKLNMIYETKINKKFWYRGITIQNYNENRELNYIHLFLNVDAEKTVLNNYWEIIVIGSMTGVLLCVIASYILSKRTLEPIEDALNKQIEFVQNASHELRTPLTIIRAKQELLLQEPESKIIDKSEDIMLTLNETKRLTKLTTDLMTLARADSSKTEIKKEEVNIDDLIKEVVRPYVEYAELEKKQIKFELKYNDSICVDVNKIYQLLIIVLDNSIKYTESGDEIEIVTYKKDNKCVIEIKDTGIGISKEAIKYIFNRFYREDKARSRKTGGSGLGLSIADSIVKAHNGNILASQNTPKGTVITIKLPK